MTRQIRLFKQLKTFLSGKPPYLGRSRIAIGSIIVSSVVGICIAPAFAQPDLLTRAEVYKLVNRAQLLPRNQPPRDAKLSDVLVPLDAIKTATRSRAELLFNEGSLARVGANAIFRFVPGTRSFQLRNGTALIMSPPGKGGTKVETPVGQVLAQALPASPAASLPPAAEPRSLAMIIHYDAGTNTQQIFALTNSNITVFDLKGGQVNLLGGQTVTIVNGVLGPVQTFDLKTFYQTSNLAIGLGPGQEAAVLQNPLAVQQTLKLVRVETLAAFNAQAKLLEGLCTLNGRGSSSTLATNCITTDSNDPLRDFQNRREVTTPPPRDTQPPVIVQPPQPPDPVKPTEPPVPVRPTDPTPPVNPNQPTGTVVLPKQIDVAPVQGNPNQPVIK